MTADPNYVKQPMDVDVLDSSGNVQGKLRANPKTQLYLWESFVNNAPNDVIAQMMEDLSPTSNDLMNPLLQNLRKKGAERWDDRSALKCKDDSQVRADDSSINKIVWPKTDDELVVSLEGFLERIIFLQKETPSGVVLSSSHITPKDNMYRDGEDFRTTQLVGEGNNAGYIFGTTDKSTKQKSVKKAILISSVRVEELKALNDLNESGITPKLYFCDIFDGKVRLFMEKIDGMTLREFMEDHMEYVRKVDLALATRFSLYVFHELLSLVNKMHVMGWTHNDLVASNVMLKASEDGLQIMIIDLGLATLLQYNSRGQKEFLSDIANVVRKFTHLHGVEFESERDIRKNWKFKVQQMNTNGKDLMEKRRLIDRALNIDSLNEVPSLLEEIASTMTFDPLMTKKDVAKIIFINSKSESNGVPSDSLQETANLMDNVGISNTTICDHHTTMEQADGGQLQRNMNAYHLPANQRMPQNQPQNMSQRNKGGMIGPGMTQQTSTILQPNTGMNQPTIVKQRPAAPMAVFSPLRTKKHHTVPEKPISPLVSPPNQNGFVHMKGGSAVATKNPSGEQQQQNKVEEKGNDKIKTESLANTTEKTPNCLINKTALSNKQTTGSAEKKVSFQKYLEPTTPASSAGPGEIANDQSYNELMSRLLKLKGSDER